MRVLPPVPPPVHQRLSRVSRDDLERMLFRSHQLLNLYADPFEEIDDRDALLGEIWELLSDSLYGPGALSTFDELLSRDPPQRSRKVDALPAASRSPRESTEADLEAATRAQTRARYRR